MIPESILRFKKREMVLVFLEARDERPCAKLLLFYLRVGLNGNCKEGRKFSVDEHRLSVSSLKMQGGENQGQSG
jgi:hypothetical protein